MKRKLIVFIVALFVLGLTAGAYAIKASRDASKASASCCKTDCCKKQKGDVATAADSKDSCCGMENCCKDGHCSMGGDCCKDCCNGEHCPMQDKQKTEGTADMSKVVFVGGDDSCCQPGADCCKGGSCCHHQKS